MPQFAETMLELPEGVHVFERGWLSSNNIFFDDGSVSWMIDSGYCTHAAQTLELVESKLGSRSLDFLINTHLHSDHCGGNSELQRKYDNLTTVIPPGQAQSVQAWDPVKLFFAPTGQSCAQFKFNETLKSESGMKIGLHEW